MALRSSSSNSISVPRSLSGTAAILALLVGGWGCVSSPKPKIDQLLVETPAQWYSADADSSGAFEAGNWAKDFNDPGLERIVDEALEYNLDFRAAAARLEAARASSVANRSVIWPTLSATGSGSRSRRSSASGIQQTLTNESFGLAGRFSWEIDLWGKLRNGYRAELADAEAAIADYYAARLSLAARTARAWYAAIEAHQQFELEQRILDALIESSRIVEENFESGIAGALDVRLVRANLASSRSALEQRRRNRDASIRSLETLLGRYPKNELEVAADLPTIRESPSAGLPSQLLLRRPDVVAAERRLAAAEQRKYETSKARLPNVDLSLMRGTSSSEPSELFDFVENRIWSQSLSIAQTLFQGGRLRANFRRARATYELNLANYSQTVLTAFREVENALAFQESYAADYEFLQLAAEESIQAEELAWEQYASGLIDITSVLDSVRRSINAQRSLIQVANQRVQSRIDLYLALGGGFES